MPWNLCKLKKDAKECRRIWSDLWENNFIVYDDEENLENIMCIFVDFFYKFGRFPGTDSDSLALMPYGRSPSFVKSTDVISPRTLYLKFKSKKSRELVAM